MTGPGHEPGGSADDIDQDEIPTSRIQAVACPRCEGAKEILVQSWPKDVFNGREWAQFLWVGCPGCVGAGRVTVGKAMELRRAYEAGPLK